MKKALYIYGPAGRGKQSLVEAFSGSYNARLALPGTEFDMIPKLATRETDLIILDECLDSLDYNWIAAITHGIVVKIVGGDTFRLWADIICVSQTPPPDSVHTSGMWDVIELQTGSIQRHSPADLFTKSDTQRSAAALLDEVKELADFYNIDIDTALDAYSIAASSDKRDLINILAAAAQQIIKDRGIVDADMLYDTVKESGD